ncbi:DUF4269 domain-containing protein [Terrimonas rubra]|uniref:DUF4269 domain-containing protein n=1 Tax=Terrimonas rubra TaxID=1035890 RepID=A0ABW6A2K0_9BACT
MLSYPHFDTLDYLANGTTIQQAAYQVLTGHGIWEKLAPFSPVLTGTIPINIYTENSDLDILCQYEDKKGYIENLVDSFSQYPGFRFYESNFQDTPTIVASFALEIFPVEIFAQPTPVKEQQAYRHMIIEHYLLQKNDAAFRQQVISLKKQGYKTEPAFAQLLNLSGDPYQALLQIPLF